MEQQNFIDIVEAAAFLSTTRNYMYKLVAARAVPYYSPGGRKLLFKRSELQEYVERSRVATKDEQEAKRQKQSLHRS